MAIVCSNSLTVLGLKQLLQNVVPMMGIDAFSSVAELSGHQPDGYFHYFVDISILLTDRLFFLERARRTIVLTTSSDHSAQLPEFHCLCVTVPEKQLVHDLLALQQHAHRHGNNMPGISQTVRTRNMLSPREIEVLSLVAKGLINKEIADRLSISLTTVITHRKNIVEKLGLKSVSSLTIYAVMNGYVDLDSI